MKMMQYIGEQCSAMQHNDAVKYNGIQYDMA